MFFLLKFIKKAIFIFIIFLVLIFFFSLGHIPKKEELEYGVTFSQKQASDLGLDWKAVYSAMFDDLGAKKLRISAYWDLLEKEENALYDWTDLDWQINLAEEKEAELILAIGGRLPRWPECHYPSWLQDATQEKREKATLDYIEKTILRYKDRSVIKAWQIENEPFLKYFGECPKFNSSFLDQEIALVKSLDDRDIVITDSGELSLWVPAAKRADIFGTTMYRDTYSGKLKRYIHYPITPGFFRFKKNVTDLFASPKKWMVIEMQGEPWGPKHFQYLSAKERSKTMDLEKFKSMIEFSSQTGFQEFYLWGVEWWYWEKEKGDSAIWNEAKKLYKK